MSNAEHVKLEGEIQQTSKSLVPRAATDEPEDMGAAWTATMAQKAKIKEAVEERILTICNSYVRIEMDFWKIADQLIV